MKVYVVYPDFGATPIAASSRDVACKCCDKLDMEKAVQHYIDDLEVFDTLEEFMEADT